MDKTSQEVRPMRPLIKKRTNPKDPVAWLEQARQYNSGNRAWRQWKLHAAEELLQLTAQTDRMQLLDLSLAGDFRAIYRIRMPVPRCPVNGRLAIADEAIFHLHYLEEWRVESPPPWAIIGLLEPPDFFHPNSAIALRGALCLGAIPAGVSPKEIALMGYSTVALQSVQLNESDPAGVLNLEACEYYRNHPEYMPLTPLGLLEPWEQQKGGP